MQRIFSAILVFTLLSIANVAAATQPKAAFFTQKAEIIWPSSMISGKKYPTIIFLPPTNFTARELYEEFAADLPSDKYIIILPPGSPASTDYLPDFMSFVAWYDTMIQGFLKSMTQYIDSKAIILTGHSLGGDLGWALAAKNPGQFRGMVISGTRCSYPLPATALTEMKSKGFKGSFYIGDQDSATRIDGLKRGYNQLKNAGVASFLEILPNHNHRNVPSPYLLKSLNWIMTGATTSTTAPEKPGNTVGGKPQAPTQPAPTPSSGQTAQTKPQSQTTPQATPKPNNNSASTVTPSNEPAMTEEEYLDYLGREAEPKTSLFKNQKALLAQLKAASPEQTIKVDTLEGEKVYIPPTVLQTLQQAQKKQLRLQVNIPDGKGKIAYIWLFEAKARQPMGGENTNYNDYTVYFSDAKTSEIEYLYGPLSQAIYFNFNMANNLSMGRLLVMPAWLFLRPSQSFVENNDTSHLYLYRYDSSAHTVHKVQSDFSLDSAGLLALPFNQGGWYLVTDQEIDDAWD